MPLCHTPYFKCRALVAAGKLEAAVAALGERIHLLVDKSVRDRYAK